MAYTVVKTEQSPKPDEIHIPTGLKEYVNEELVSSFEMAFLYLVYYSIIQEVVKSFM